MTLIAEIIQLVTSLYQYTYIMKTIAQVNLLYMPL